MPENYDHYISKNIRAFYKKRLFSPILYLLLLLILWLLFPLHDMLLPKQLSENTSFEASFSARDRYVRTTLHNLKFSGYTSEAYGQTRGYYYYTTRNGQCSIILLTPYL